MNCLLRDFVQSGEVEIRTGPFGTQLKASEYVEQGTPVLNVKNLGYSTVVKSKLDQVGPSTIERLSMHILHCGDIVFGRKGAVDRHAYISGEEEGWMQGSDCIRVRVKTEKINSRYLSYYFLTPEHRTFMISMCSHGTTMASLNQKILEMIEVPLPDRSVQDGIVSLLRMLDDKVELNQKINQNLQQQAFILFDRFLSVEHSSKCPLSRIAMINPKRILKKGKYARYIDMAQLSTSGSFPNGWESKPYNGGMRFSNGDTLLARITPCLENGKTAYIDFLGENEVAFGSTEYVVISSRGEYPPEFFYCLARCPSFVDYAVKNMNGSSGRQRVSAETIGNYLLPALTEGELQEFRSTVPCLFKMIRNNAIESMVLTQLRDSLLPRLISGEIDVSNIKC